MRLNKKSRNQADRESEDTSEHLKSLLKCSNFAWSPSLTSLKFFSELKKTALENIGIPAQTTTKAEVDLRPDKDRPLPEQPGHTPSSSGLSHKLQRADSEQGYGFASLTISSLFWKHFLIKCKETGEAKPGRSRVPRGHPSEQPRSSTTQIWCQTSTF